jgi:hypothetical protein
MININSVMLAEINLTQYTVKNTKGVLICILIDFTFNAITVS